MDLAPVIREDVQCWNSNELAAGVGCSINWKNLACTSLEQRFSILYSLSLHLYRQCHCLYLEVYAQVGYFPGGEGLI